MSTHLIFAHRTKSGVVVSDGIHANYFTGSRYGWRVLLRGRKNIPDEHERDVARQTAGRGGIPFSDSKNARVLRRGYIQN